MNIYPQYTYKARLIDEQERIKEVSPTLKVLFPPRKEPKMSLTPLQLKMLLHYYTTSEPYSIHDAGHAYSRGVCEQRGELINLELLEDNLTRGSGYAVTERGKKHLEHIQNLALPVLVKTWEYEK